MRGAMLIRVEVFETKTLKDWAWGRFDIDNPVTTHLRRLFDH